jgi:hypothetical protein
MAKEYDHWRHTHCMIKLPESATTMKPRDWWTGTFSIVMVTGERVWFNGSYSNELFPGVVKVSDGISLGFDPDGNCILSVPMEWCTFYTEEEAGDIEACIDADRKLLRYAT